MGENLATAVSLNEAQERAAVAAKALQPRAPITSKELFAGRWTLLTMVADAVPQPGLHVVIFGERGVGKTSLANVLAPTISVFDERQPPNVARIIVRANANRGDDFSAIWLRLLDEITWHDGRPGIGLQALERPRKSFREAFGIENFVGIDEVRRILAQLPGSVFIIDEFDRAAERSSREFTDLIKSLSDFVVDCTIVLVGVASSVDQLVDDHNSINRALVQVHVPRMEVSELRQILTNAENALEVHFSDESKQLIVSLSQGLPHYTHLIGLHAVRTALLKRLSTTVEKLDTFEALREAARQAQQTVTEKFTKATHSARPDALHKSILLACAITAATARDASGYFTPGALVKPLGVILKRNVEIAIFNKHLAEFCTAKRGTVLERIGQARSYRYRFTDPLLVPFVFMEALSAGLIGDGQIVELLGSRIR